MLTFLFFFLFLETRLDNYHQRLAKSDQINCALGEEDNLDGHNTEIVYEVKNIFLCLKKSLTMCNVYRMIPSTM